MARIGDGLLKEWLDGMVVKSTEYKQEREILRAAINDNYDRLVQKYDKTEVDDLLASLDETIRSDVYSKDETITQIAIHAGKSGFIDGGNFTDVYSSQLTMIDGGEF